MLSLVFMLRGHVDKNMQKNNKMFSLDHLLASGESVFIFLLLFLKGKNVPLVSISFKKQAFYNSFP
jgi:hypothetical protein